MGLSTDEIGGIVFVSICFLCVATGALIFMYQERERKRMQEGTYYSSNTKEQQRETSPLLKVTSKSVTTTSASDVENIV